MRKGKERNILAEHQSASGRPERDMDSLQGGLHNFRDSIRLEAEKPDLFWARQRSAIMERIQGPKSRKHRRALLWVPAAVAAMLCLLFFAETGKAPTPDLAAGYDQDLLVEIERALSRNYPDSLSPALLLIPEIEQGNGAGEQP